MQCLRLLNKNVLDVLDSKISYKSIGSFKTRREAEEAIANYYMNPIDNADARILMRIYMMERFLERVSHSKYADSFII